MAYGWFIPAIYEIYAHSWFLGSRGFGSVIPANSALVFDVELVSLQKASREEL
jgi:hypothetical protein